MRPLNAPAVAGLFLLAIAAIDVCRLTLEPSLLTALSLAGCAWGSGWTLYGSGWLDPRTTKDY